MKLAYFSQVDILHLVISEGEEANSVEVNPNITAELNDQGELVGIEILHASTFVRNAIVEGVQAGAQKRAALRGGIPGSPEDLRGAQKNSAVARGSPERSSRKQTGPAKHFLEDRDALRLIQGL
jgi:uncharacterized protein YuzE